MTIDLREALPERPIRLGRYDVTGLIRAGGMGTVYEAIDREHGTRVALKTLNHLDPGSLLRFKNEFRAAADLSHPNLVPLYELSCHDDIWFFTMERIDGVNFIESLGRRLSPREAETIEAASVESAITPGSDATNLEGSGRPRANVRDARPSSLESVTKLRGQLSQLVSAVRALHGAGLLHLDLKPSNVLVDRRGRVVVLDFGLARPIQAEASSTGADEVRIVGTPAWMAPEQYDGHSIGQPVDWYAVGLMLYLALTGVPAFATGSVAVMRYSKLYLTPTSPDRLVDDVPGDLAALALALLDPEPSRRPDGEAMRAFTSGRALDGAPVDTHVRSGLVGRESERASFRDAIGHVRTGGTAIVQVIGPSGLGKSALLRALLEDTRAAGEALVLAGRCYERETVPYKAFDGMLDELAARLGTRPSDEVQRDLPDWINELSRVFPVLATVPAIAARLDESAAASVAISVVELRRRAVEAARTLFSNLAGRMPLVLEIDDLQWADADSTALLLKLLQQPAPAGLLIAVAFRAEEARANAAVTACLDAVRRLDPNGAIHVVSIDVGPLPPVDAERLATETLSALGVQTDGLPVSIAEEAGGVPFFIEELAQFVAQQRTAGAAVATMGISLEHVLAQRVQSLPDAERALVEVLAVANSPIPLTVSFAVAGIETGVLRALWSLGRGQFVRATGTSAEDQVELHHDRIRESVLSTMQPERIEQHHLALGRALAVRGEHSVWLFDAVRHLNAVHTRLDRPGRAAAARLDLRAGVRARQAAAFPLAFDCFRAGTRLLGPDAWADDYDLALALFAGAAETAYLSAAWAELDAFVAEVKSHGRTLLDQLSVWEVQIDAHVARNEFAAAVRAGLEVLRLLDVELPQDPSGPEVGAEIGRATSALQSVGADGLAGLPPASDPKVIAAMRIEVRISSAAYFAVPMLLPVLACRLVTTSVEHGLSPATPYALSLYGIVLNSMGKLPDAHAWGSIALALLDRFEDKGLEARTRHVVHDLVCTWTVPLRSTLDDLRRVVPIGKATGDLEYAAYAAHAFVHNAFYAACDLESVEREAVAAGAFMRGCEQVNALHVHTPFEQLLGCFTGRAADSASLDGEAFDEQGALRAAEAAGSRSAQCIVRLLMGIVRYHFGSVRSATEHLESARPFLDGVASTWHTPMFHQYAALAILALDEPRRGELAGAVEASLSALRAVAEHGPDNFSHRVALVEAEMARASGDAVRAVERYGRAIDGAAANDWFNDLGLAHELAARFHDARGDAAERDRHVRDACDAYHRWGAHAKLARLRPPGWSPKP